MGSYPGTSSSSTGKESPNPGPETAQYGASLGGPIVQDRTFYFANFEQRRLNQSGLTTITPGDVAALNAHLTAVGYRGPLITTGMYPNPVHNSNFLAKLDHQFSQKDQLAVRYSFYGVHSDNSRGAGGLSAATARPAVDLLTWGILDTGYLPVALHRIGGFATESHARGAHPSA